MRDSYSRLACASVSDRVVTRVAGLDVSRVAFACDSDPTRSLYLRHLTKLRFDGKGRRNVWYRGTSGILCSSRLIEATFEIDRSVAPLRGILRFKDGETIPVDLLVPNQTAVITFVPKLPEISASAVYSVVIEARSKSRRIEVDKAPAVFAQCSGGFCCVPYKPDSGKETAHGWFCDDCVYEVRNLGDPVL